MNKQEIAIFGALVASIVMVNLNSNTPAATMNFDLEAEDPLTVASYAESLDNYKKHNISYIVARVQTMINGKPFWRFIDAQEFNKIVLGGLVSANDQQPEMFQDPVSREPIVGVEYLIVKKDDKGAITLEKLCSYNDLFLNKENREFWKDVLRANQYEDPKMQAKSWLRLGYHYLAGEQTSKNAQKTLEYFLRAFDQTADDDVADQARQQIEMIVGGEMFRTEATSGRDQD